MTTASLVHDVGKYITRIARNLPKEGPIPPALVGMLAKDLYETHRGRRASVRFEELASDVPEGPLSEVRALLVEIDALEASVRAGDPIAVRRAAALALEVDARLRALAPRGAP